MQFNEIYRYVIFADYSWKSESSYNFQLKKFKNIIKNFKKSFTIFYKWTEYWWQVPVSSINFPLSWK